MSNPTVKAANYNDYKLWKITANNPSDTIAATGGLNGDTNFDGLTPSQISNVISGPNPDSTGNPFEYTCAENGVSIVFKELQYIGGAVNCIFNDSTNPGNTYTVGAVLCEQRIDVNTLVSEYVA